MEVASPGRIDGVTADVAGFEIFVLHCITALLVATHRFANVQNSKVHPT